MDIDHLTIGDARKIAAMFGENQSAITANLPHSRQPVVVCTDKRGVVFGYTTNAHADPIALTDARMALYWSKETGGVFGLAETGPAEGSKISATASSVSLAGITAVFRADPEAEKAWIAAPISGR